MKNKILMGTVFGFGLVLAANAAFAEDAVPPLDKVPTAEKLVADACDRSLSILRSSLDVANKNLKNSLEQNPKQIVAEQKEFSRQAASIAVDSLDEMQKIKSLLKAGIGDTATKYSAEMAKLSSMPLPRTVRLIVTLNASAEESVINPLKQAFNDAGYRLVISNSQIMNSAAIVYDLLKEDKETGAKVALLMPSDGAPVSVKYSLQKLIPQNSEPGAQNGQFEISSVELLGDNFSADVTWPYAHLRMDSGTYGRAGIELSDSPDIKKEKLAARFFKIIHKDQAERLNRRVQEVETELAEVKVFCEKQQPALDPK